jgi:hypothetical protein
LAVWFSMNLTVIFRMQLIFFLSIRQRNRFYVRVGR